MNMLKTVFYAWVLFVRQLFVSTWQARNVKTWPPQPKRCFFWRMLTQPLFVATMGGKISRSKDWVDIRGRCDHDSCTRRKKGICITGALDDFLKNGAVTIEPNKKAKFRDGGTIQMALAMLTWDRCVVLTPMDLTKKFRIGFISDEFPGHGLVKQYCSIVFPPGISVRVLHRPYTTTYFAVDSVGNPISLRQDQRNYDHNLWDPKFISNPLI